VRRLRASTQNLSSLLARGRAASRWPEEVETFGFRVSVTETLIHKWVLMQPSPAQILRRSSEPARRPGSLTRHLCCLTQSMHAVHSAFTCSL
jgi:hypothetical protein